MLVHVPLLGGALHGGGDGTLDLGLSPTAYLSPCDSERDSHPFLPVKPKRGSGCPPGPGKDAMCGGGPRTRRALSEYQPLSLLGLFPVFLCHLHFYFHHRDIPPSRCPTLQNCSLMEGELSSLHRVMCKLALVFPSGRFQL